MRSSKRELILESALAVVAKDGVTAVTFESVASASGLTKGGLLYHFPTKDALILALHEHQAQRWEAELREALGGEPEDATADERLVAYARVSAHQAQGTDLQLLLEASTDPVLNEPWMRVIRRWTPDPDAIDPTDPREMAKLVAYLAADGLWLSETVGGIPLPPELRTALVEHLARSLRPSDEPSVVLDPTVGAGQSDGSA